MLGIVAIYGPLGFVEEGRDLVACFRDADAARLAREALSASRVRSDLVTDIPEGDPLEVFRAAGLRELVHAESLDASMAGPRGFLDFCP